MGLQAIFKGAAQTIFEAFDDVPISSIYSSVSDDITYDPTGSGAITDTVTNQTVDIIFAYYETAQIDGTKIRASDQKAMIPVENLTATPGQKDYITTNAKRWNVVAIETDPAEALWIMQIRKP